MLRLPTAITATAIALLIAAAAPASAKTCINKAGEGTGGNVDSAEFQAYEIILQTTDMGMWTNWMLTSQKVGVAPGYTVSNLKKKCGPGGSLGTLCRIQATLCK
jgi:hypothetical protein